VSRFEWAPGYRRIVAQSAWDAWRRENEPKIVAAIRAEAPVDTGQLKSSVRVSPSGETVPPGLPVLRAEAVTDYAYIQHEGRGVVRPVNARVLRWFDKVTGQKVFAMKSGPVKPNRFIIRALEGLGLKTRSKT